MSERVWQRQGAWCSQVEEAAITTGHYMQRQSSPRLVGLAVKDAVGEGEAQAVGLQQTKQPSVPVRLGRRRAVERVAEAKVDLRHSRRAAVPRPGVLEG